jgi:MFS family permease
MHSGHAAVMRLAVAQALGGANSAVVFAIGAIIGNMLAPSKGLSTLPLSVFVVGMAASTLPAGTIARRHGRRAAFLIGTGCGVLAGLLAALAVVLGSFWLFCAATLFSGAYAAVVLSFRFAAADCVMPERRSRALSAVMAGGSLRRGHRPAARHLHHGPMAAIPVCGDIPGASRCRSPIRNRPARRPGSDPDGG